MVRWWVGWFLLMFALAKADESAPTRRVSLPQVTLQNHLELTLAAVEEAAAQERLAMVQHGFLPTLSIGAGFSRLDGRQQGSFGELRQTEFERYEPQVGIALAWNVGERLHQVRARWHDYLASRYRLLDVRQKVLLGIGQWYQSLVLARAGVKIAEQLAEARREIAELIRVRVAGGVALQSDLAQAQAALAEAQSQTVAARNEWKQVSIRLAQVLRWDQNVLLVPEEEMPQAHPVAGLPPEDVSSRFDLKRLQQNMAASQENIDSAWWQLLGPNLEVEWRHTGLGARLNDLAAQGYFRIFLGWRLSLDKWDQIRLREREFEIIKTQLQQLHDAAKAEAASARNQIEAAKARLPLAQERLEASQEYLELASARYQGGKALLLEVLGAQTELARAKFDLAAAAAEYNLSQIRYLAALGALEPQRFPRSGQEP